MEIIRKVDTNTFYIEYIHAFNGFLRLSNKEILVLAAFLEEESKLNEHSKELLFETTIRKRIQDKLGITVYNLNNYISMLKGKGVIKVDERDRIFINSKIIPKIENGKSLLTYKFVINAETEGNKRRS